MNDKQHRPIVILPWIIAAIALLGALALLDEERESSAALDDFAAEQATTARGIAAALATSPLDPTAATRALSGAEKPGDTRALLRAPREDTFRATGGDRVRSPALLAAVTSNQSSVRLSRDDAAALGLPARMAMAGIAPFGNEGWQVIVATTARRTRDRNSRAFLRLALGFGLTSALVLAFGGLARRTQRKEVALARALAAAEERAALDERLVRADKLATLGALATGIAHEVATPLGVIVARAEQVLPKVEDDERAKRAVTTIMDQATRIERVVRGILSLARGGTPTLEHVDPASLAKEAMDLVEHRFQKSGVSLSLEAPPDLPVVACDPKLFEQVLVNLLLNAESACEAGGHVVLRISTNGERVELVVEDDGIGVTKEIAERAVEPFFTTNGTGLGLAIATEIVKHHHGELVLAPRTDAKGTRATVAIGIATSQPDSSR